MVDRTCASCGALVGTLVDVCPKCGGDPDLRLLELGAGAGRRRDLPTEGGPPSPRRSPLGWKRWTPIVAVVIALWGFLALTAGDGDDEETAEPPGTTEEPKREPTTSTTRRPRPSTTTTTTIPLTERAPLLGGETGLTLMYNDGRVHLLDLDTGVQVDLSLSVTVFGAVDGRLLVSQNGRMSWWPAPYDGTGAESLGASSVGDAWLDAEGGIVWLANPGRGGELTVRSVGPDGTVLTERTLPMASYPAGVVGGRLILSAPGGTFAVEAVGDVELISTGQVMGVGDEHVVVSRCEADLECRYEILDADGDVVDTAPVGDASAYYGPYYGGIVTVSPGGRIAQATTDGTGRTIVTVDDLPVTWDAPEEGVSALGWSPDSRWLVVGPAPGGIVIIDAETLSVVTEIPSTRIDSPTWRVFVLEGIELQP